MKMSQEISFIPEAEEAKLKVMAHEILATSSEPKKTHATKNPIEPIRKAINLAMAYFLVKDDLEAKRELFALGQYLSRDLISHVLGYEGPQMTEILAEGAMHLGYALQASLASNKPELNNRLGAILETRWSDIEEECSNGFPWIASELFLIQIVNKNTSGVLALLNEHEETWVEFEGLPSDDPELKAIRALCEKNITNFMQAVQRLYQRSCERLANTKIENGNTLSDFANPSDLFNTLIAALLHVAQLQGMDVDPLAILPPRTAWLWGFG